MLQVMYFYEVTELDWKYPQVVTPDMHETLMRQIKQFTMENYLRLIYYCQL